MSHTCTRIVSRRHAIATLVAVAVTSTRAFADESVTHVVEIKDLEFFPATLNVAPGDKITWINRDWVPHTATALDGSWDTGELKKDQRATVDVTDAMSLNYWCVFHPMMKATLEVAR